MFWQTRSKGRRMYVLTNKKERKKNVGLTLTSKNNNNILIIAFKGAIRDFLQSPHSAANCLQHARSSGPGAIVCKSCATHRALITCKCRVTCHLVRRDSSAIKFDRVEIAFIWAYFVGWIIKLMKEGRKPEYPEKTPGNALQKRKENVGLTLTNK